MKTPALLLLVASLGYAGFAFGGLVWQEKALVKRAFGDKDVVSTAQFYCDNLGSTGEWRLPSSQELAGSVGHARLSNGGLYWSSTLAHSRHREALAIDSTTGKVRADSVFAEHWVLCVRATR